MEEQPSSLAERLVSARTESGLGQDAVARAIKISQQSYSDLETGKSRSTTRIGSLAHLFGVDAYWLETGSGARRNPRVDEQRETYWPMPPPRDMPNTPEERAMLRVFRSMTERQRRGLLAAFGKPE